MLKLNAFPPTRRTDRDCEIPNLFDFLQRKKETFSSVLDVGAHYSADYYANEIRLQAKTYHAIDPNRDEAVERIVDKYFVGDFITTQLNTYDLVVCLSTIEHVGMYPIKYMDRISARDMFFEKLLKTTQKYLWISFPVGKPYEVKNELSIIPPDQCEHWFELIKPYKNDVGLYYSQGPQAGHSWGISTKEQCYANQYIDSIGNQTLCILEIEK